VRFDVVPAGRRHAGELLVTLFGDERPMTAPDGPRAGRHLVRVDGGSGDTEAVSTPPLHRPIDVRVDPSGSWVYLLKFGRLR
jgi:hypothetical protein